MNATALSPSRESVFNIDSALSMTPAGQTAFSGRPLRESEREKNEIGCSHKWSRMFWRTSFTAHCAAAVFAFAAALGAVGMCDRLSGNPACAACSEQSHA